MRTLRCGSAIFVAGAGNREVARCDGSDISWQAQYFVRDRRVDAQSAAPATKSATGDAQSAARATKSAHPDSHRAALPRRFAVAGIALCERYFVFDTN